VSSKEVISLLTSSGSKYLLRKKCNEQRKTSLIETKIFAASIEISAVAVIPMDVEAEKTVVKKFVADVRQQEIYQETSIQQKRATRYPLVESTAFASRGWITQTHS
jgi:hypothetical protein